MFSRNPSCIYNNLLRLIAADTTVEVCHQGEAELIIWAQLPLSDLLISSQVLYGLWWQVTCCYGLAERISCLSLWQTTTPSVLLLQAAAQRSTHPPTPSPHLPPAHPPGRLLQWFRPAADWICSAPLKKKKTSQRRNFVSGGSRLHVHMTGHIWLLPVKKRKINLASWLLGEMMGFVHYVMKQLLRHELSEWIHILYISCACFSRVTWQGSINTVTVTDGPVCYF